MYESTLPGKKNLICIGSTKEMQVFSLPLSFEASNRKPDSSSGI
jgi:hypothetical protein